MRTYNQRTTAKRYYDDRSTPTAATPPSAPASPAAKRPRVEETPIDRSEVKTHSGRSLLPRHFPFFAAGAAATPPATPEQSAAIQKVNEELAAFEMKIADLIEKINEQKQNLNNYVDNVLETLPDLTQDCAEPGRDMVAALIEGKFIKGLSKSTSASFSPAEVTAFDEKYSAANRKLIAAQEKIKVAIQERLKWFEDGCAETKAAIEKLEQELAQLNAQKQDLLNKKAALAMPAPVPAAAAAAAAAPAGVAMKVESLMSGGGAGGGYSPQSARLFVKREPHQPGPLSPPAHSHSAYNPRAIG